MVVKFAVVREDPLLEVELVERLRPRTALLVASGGCTAFELKRRFPEMAIAAFDFNPDQLAHVRRKAAAVEAGELEALNVESDDREGLSQCGDFERLFRYLRVFVEEFVASPEELEEFFRLETEAGRRTVLREEWFHNAYWPAAFEAVFNGPFLNAMFGPDATRHAAPGSYPGYFQKVIERGLSRADASENPFLTHIFLGRYPRPLPYHQCRRNLKLELIEGTLTDVEGLARFGLISLSNLFDWTSEEVGRQWGRLLSEEAAEGTAILIRQLNNQRNLRAYFEPHFEFDEELGESFLKRDRSLFYERIHVGFRRASNG